jgi:hypothetical protein
LTLAPELATYRFSGGAAIISLGSTGRGQFATFQYGILAEGETFGGCRNV